MADLQEVIKQAKLLFLTKNEGNLVQDFIWQTQHLTTGDAKKPGVPVDKETAKQHGDQAVEGLRTLGRLILSNGQFRKLRKILFLKQRLSSLTKVLVNDVTILIRDIVGDAATTTASRVKPSEEQLAQIDHAAEDNTWHDVPDLSKDSLRNQLKEQYNKQKPFGKSEARDAAGNAVDSAQQPNGDLDAGSGAATAAGQLKEQGSANVPDETKEKAKDAQNRLVTSSKDYIGKKVPQERRDQTILRLKKMIVEIQGHSDCSLAFVS